MNLWRVEWLRLVRTRRWIALAGVFLFFGLLGPFTARYMDVLIGRLAGEVEVRLPAPTPADGIAQYMNNASQIGLLVVLALAASALAFDARPESAAFYRTRVAGPWRLLLPRITVMAAAAAAGFVLGAAGAWYETVVLLGPLPVGGTLAGIGYGCLYFAFAVVVTAFATAIVRAPLGVLVLAAGMLLALPLLGLVPELRPWLPSHLLGAPVALARGGDAVAYLRAALVTLTAATAILPLTARLLEAREI